MSRAKANGEPAEKQQHPSAQAGRTPHFPLSNGNLLKEATSTESGTPEAGPRDSAASRTENGAPAFKTSGAACLDLFFQVVPGIDRAPCIKKRRLRDDE